MNSLSVLEESDEKQTIFFSPGLFPSLLTTSLENPVPEFFPKDSLDTQSISSNFLDLPFSKCSSANEEEEEEISFFEKMYFITQKKEKIDEEKLFEEKICEEIKSSETLKKKRGRKTLSEDQTKITRHAAEDIDNVQRKIQVNFFTFLINFTNDAIKYIFGQVTKSSFKQIDYELKRIIDFKNFEKIKKWKLKDILKLDISRKFSSYEKDHNQYILERLVLRKSEIFERFIDQTFIDIFSKYYFDNQKNTDEVYFENIKIKFSPKTKNFYHLIKGNDNLKNIILKIVNEFYFYDINDTEVKNFFNTNHNKSNNEKKLFCLKKEN